MIKSWFFAWKLKRAANRLIEAQKVIQANGLAVVKIEEAAGTFYLINQTDGSRWRLKAAK